MNKSCKTCLFKDVCDAKKACGHYTPLKNLAEDEADDVVLEIYIENARYEYRNEWQRYAREDAE